MRFETLIRAVAGAAGVEGVRVAGNPEILRVCEDSRQVRAGDLFVARSGTKANGAQFAADAVARGAVAVVGDGHSGQWSEASGQWSVVSGQWEQRGVASAVVEDVNLALALLAHELAGNPTRGMKMIGVTGTKGKTTVAYLMRSVLKAAGFKVGMIGTVEIDDGVKVVPAEMTTPGVVELAELFGRMRDNGVTHCVMEVSSHALHQQRVAGIDFDVAIFTNLTGDHLDYHKTMEEYAAAKAILFAGLKEEATAVVNGDDKWVGRMVGGTRARVERVGMSDGTAARNAVAIQWMGDIQVMTSAAMEMTVGGAGTVEVLETPLVGRHNAYNILCVVATASALGIPPEGSVAMLIGERGAPGRLQRVERRGDFQVFVDYAHTHDALENVLRALRQTMGAVRTGDASHGTQEPPDGGTTNGRVTMGPSRADDGIAGERHGAANCADPWHPGTAEHGTRGSTQRPPYGGTTNDGSTNGRLICVFGCGGDRDRTKRPKMGAVAERLADVVIVTSDNPRTEEPGGIIEEICAGFSAGWKTAGPIGRLAVPEGGKITVEPDRRAAIRMAIEMADAGDVVLIAGKGHENYQIIGTTKHHFDDVEEADAAMRKRETRNAKRET